MLIVFSTLQQHQTFHLKVATLEEGFDWLNALVATGYQLCSIYLVDEHSNIRLPVDAFDGQPMSGVFLSLAQQWQELLRPLSRQRNALGGGLNGRRAAWS